MSNHSDSFLYTPHRWVSLDSPSLVASYLTGRPSKVAWRWAVSKHINWHGFLRDRSWTPSLLHIHYTLGTILPAHGLLPTIGYADDTQLLSLFQPMIQQGSLHGSPAAWDISAVWKHSPTLNLAKTELLVVPATPSLQHDFSIQLGTSIITPSTSIRNLGVIFDDQLTFKEHIAKTARSCRFALHNIRKIRPFLTEHAAQLLSRPLSFLGWTTAMLFWLVFHQTQSTSTNDSECCGTTGLQWAQKNPCYTSLHLTALATSGSSHQVQDHWCLHTERPQAQHPPTSTHYYESTSPPEVWDLLVSDALCYHHREAQNHSPEHFSFTIPGWWNNLPTPIRNAGSLSIFKQQLKTHLFRHYLTS